MQAVFLLEDGLVGSEDEERALVDQIISRGS